MLKRFILPMLIAGIALFPIYFALLFSADTLGGSRQILNWIAYESQHAFLYQEMRDIVSSLFIALLIVLIASFVVLALAQRHRLPATLTAAAALAFALIFLGFRVDQALLFAATLLIAMLCALLTARVLSHD